MGIVRQSIAGKPEVSWDSEDNVEILMQMNNKSFCEFTVSLFRKLVGAFFPYGLILGLLCGMVIVALDHFEKDRFANYILGGMVVITILFRFWIIRRKATSQ